SGSGWKSRYLRARAATRAKARAFRTSWKLRSWMTAPEVPGRACATRGRCGGSGCDQPCAVRGESYASAPEQGSSRPGRAPGSGQQGGEGLGVDRVPDPVALREVAAAFAQDRVLAFLLHALGDHGDAERMRHGDDRGGQGEVVRVAQHVGDEAAVDLDAV